MTTASPTPTRDPWRRVWHALAGDRWLAAVLLALAGLLLAAALLPQTPQSDPVAYSRWLSETQQRFGSLTAPLISLGLFSVTQAIGFRLLAALLALSAALRLIDTVGRWRELRRFPDQPVLPKLDRAVELNRAGVQAQLRDFSFRSNDDLIVAERFQRRSIVAAIALNAGVLIVLAGLVLAVVADTRTDAVIVEPGVVTTLPGTPYTLRLDALNDGRAAVAVLSEGQPVTQGELADRQPLQVGGVSIYLRGSGPALIVTATQRSGQMLGLQSTVDSPPQPEKFLSFTPDRGEVFVAAPDAGIVLQLTWLSADRYTAQALQMATGKMLASREIAPGDTLNVDAVTFKFSRAAFITVAVVQQPARWLILPGWLLVNLGVLGSLVWRSSRVWLEERGDQTRLMSDDDQIDPAVGLALGVQPIGRLRPTLGRMAAAAWLIWTTTLIVIMVQIYPQAASLDADGFKSTAWLAAWLLLTGSVFERSRAGRIVLLIAGGLAGAIAVALSVT